MTDTDTDRPEGLDFVKQFIGTKYEGELERIAPELVAQARAEYAVEAAVRQAKADNPTMTNDELIELVSSDQTLRKLVVQSAVEAEIHAMLRERAAEEG